RPGHRLALPRPGHAARGVGPAVGIDRRQPGPSHAADPCVFAGGARRHPFGPAGGHLGVAPRRGAAPGAAIQQRGRGGGGRRREKGAVEDLSSGDHDPAPVSDRGRAADGVVSRACRVPGRRPRRHELGRRGGKRSMGGQAGRRSHLSCRNVVVVVDPREPSLARPRSCPGRRTDLALVHGVGIFGKLLPAALSRDFRGGSLAGSGGAGVHGGALQPAHLHGAAAPAARPARGPVRGVFPKQPLWRLAQARRGALPPRRRPGLRARGGRGVGAPLLRGRRHRLRQRRLQALCAPRRARRPPAGRRGAGARDGGGGRGLAREPGPGRRPG
ncbi:hypothetical protein H632_c4053p0, partial [Helicosporidium sp. ATCC 50920]